MFVGNHAGSLLDRFLTLRFDRNGNGLIHGSDNGIIHRSGSGLIHGELTLIVLQVALGRNHAQSTNGVLAKSQIASSVKRQDRRLLRSICNSIRNSIGRSGSTIHRQEIVIGRCIVDRLIVSLSLLGSHRGILLRLFKSNNRFLLNRQLRLRNGHLVCSARLSITKLCLLGFFLVKRLVLGFCRIGTLIRTAQRIQILLKWDILREFIGTRRRRNRVHNAQHGSHGGFVADCTRGVGHGKAIKKKRNRTQKGNQGEQDGNNPKHRFESTRERKQAKDGNGRRNHHSNREKLVDKRTIVCKRFAAQKIGTRRIIMRNYDNRTIARGSKGARCLMIGDNVLRKTVGSNRRDRDLIQTNKHVQNAQRKNKQEAKNTQCPADSHKNRGNKQYDSRNGRNIFSRRRGGKFLYLGIKTVVGENTCDDICSGAFFLAAGRGNLRALQKMIQIFFTVSHVGLHIAVA